MPRERLGREVPRRHCRATLPVKERQRTASTGSQTARFRRTAPLPSGLLFCRYLESEEIRTVTVQQS